MATWIHILCIATSLLPAEIAKAQADAPVFNGSFEQDANKDGIPDGWATAGRPGIEQRLTLVADPQRGHVAKLSCTRFVPGFPDSHVMLAQLDRVGVRAGQWYHLRLWARAKDLESASARVALVNRQRWANAGLDDSFAPREAWEPFEFFFRAKEDLKPQDSRFQIWFSGTGTLYVDDVTLEPIPELRRQWHPQLPMTGVTNAIPNSGFECGGAPRKQYAAQAALSRLLGPDVEFVHKWTEPAWLQAFEFRSRGRTVTVLWTRKAGASALTIPKGCRALDLMGNRLAGPEIIPTDVPVYWVQD